MEDALRIVSPADGSVYFEGSFASDTELDAAIEAASAAAGRWRQVPVEERVALVDRLVETFARQALPLRDMVSWQIGRPHAKADELDGFRYMYDFYKSSLPEFTCDSELPGNQAERRFVRREPFGLNFSICAWNYPVAMMAGQVLAPLLLGNVVVFKHAPQTARVGAVLRQAAQDAGLPSGVLQILDLTNRQSAKLLASGAVGLVNFIGSTRGGQEVRTAAAGRLMHEILELGGKDPAYVRSDADIEWAASELAWASFGNSGQSCCSVERIYVDAAVYEDFVAALIASARALTIGHPILTDSRLGPVVSAQAAARIEAEVAAAEYNGAKQVLGVEASDLPPGGAYVRPKILLDVTHDMTIMRAETFGPVAPVMKVASDEQAIELMNDSAFGLTASIWTADTERGLQLARAVEAGNVFVNRADYVDDHLPWGGVKSSGLGRTDGDRWGANLTTQKGYYALRTP